MESNRHFEGVIDAEVDRIVGELRLGWRIGMCQVPAGFHMSIADDDGKDPKREELGCPRHFGCEDRWEDNETVVEMAVGWIDRRRRKGVVRSGAGSRVVVYESLQSLEINRRELGEPIDRPDGPGV